MKSVLVANIFAASENMQEMKGISHVYRKINVVKVRLQLYIVSKDLFASFPTQKHLVDRSLQQSYRLYPSYFEMSILVNSHIDLKRSS